MADYYQPQRQYRGPLENDNGYPMSSLNSADYQGVQPQNKLIDIIDTYQMQPKQGQGMMPSKSSNALNDYYSPTNYQNGSTSPMQDYSAYQNPHQAMNLRVPAYDSQADYQGSASYRAPREILSKRFIQPEDLRSHPGYGSINTMRNPMYANHNYLKNQQGSPSKNAPVFQDSIDALHYNLADKSSNQAISSYNNLSSYRGEEPAPQMNYNNRDANLNKSRAPNDSQNTVSQREKLNYYNDEMFASPKMANKAGEGYSSPNLRSKAYLNSLSSSSDKNPLEYGVKLTSPIKRNPKDIYVFNPLTQTPLLRFQGSHLLKKPEYN